MAALPADLKREIYRASHHLGARSDLLSILGSWIDTADDEQTLEALRNWNARQER